MARAAWVIASTLLALVSVGSACASLGSFEKPVAEETDSAADGAASGSDSAPSPASDGAIANDAASDAACIAKGKRCTAEGQCCDDATCNEDRECHSSCQKLNLPCEPFTKQNCCIGLFCSSAIRCEACRATGEEPIDSDERSCCSYERMTNGKCR